jgi:hypothetical protein
MSLWNKAVADWADGLSAGMVRELLTRCRSAASWSFGVRIHAFPYEAAIGSLTR